VFRLFTSEKQLNHTQQNADMMLDIHLAV